MLVRPTWNRTVTRIPSSSGLSRESRPPLSESWLRRARICRPFSSNTKARIDPRSLTRVARSPFRGAVVAMTFITSIAGASHERQVTKVRSISGPQTMAGRIPGVAVFFPVLGYDPMCDNAPAKLIPDTGGTVKDDETIGCFRACCRLGGRLFWADGNGMERLRQRKAQERR